MAERRRSAGRSRSSSSKASNSKASGSKSSGTRKGGSSSAEDRILGAAPSSPDIRKLQLLEPSEEAKAHEPSTVDAMGQDKRRQVVGHSYGPTRRTQVMFFVAVGVAVVVLVGGWLSLVSIFDTPPNHFSDKAPWSTPAANAEAAAQQNTKPVSPDTACGEPGNQYPIPAQSPCAPPSKANDFQGASPGE